MRESGARGGPGAAKGGEEAVDSVALIGRSLGEFMVQGPQSGGGFGVVVVGTER